MIHYLTKQNIYLEEMSPKILPLIYISLVLSIGCVVMDEHYVQGSPIKFDNQSYLQTGYKMYVDL